MEEVRLIDANALHKRIETNLHASNPFTIEECCYKDALNLSLIHISEPTRRS